MDPYIFRNFETFRRATDFINSYHVLQSFNEFMANITLNQLFKEFQSLKEHLQAIIQNNDNYII